MMLWGGADQRCSN